MLAPYLAVGLCWSMLSNGWLALLAYHAQILFWARPFRPETFVPWRQPAMLLALPAALAGPLLYVLLPYMAHVDLGVWLTHHGLAGWTLWLMIPYFGLVHPVLEQIHWGPLRRQTLLAHPAFAGYHMLVLYSLLTVPWLVVCFIVLATSSFLWHQMAERSGSLAAPTLMHVLADLGIVVAAWLSVG